MTTTQVSLPRVLKKTSLLLNNNKLAQQFWKHSLVPFLRYRKILLLLSNRSIVLGNISNSACKTVMLPLFCYLMIEGLLLTSLSPSQEAFSVLETSRREQLSLLFTRLPEEPFHLVLAYAISSSKRVRRSWRHLLCISPVILVDFRVTSSLCILLPWRDLFGLNRTRV